MFKLVLEKAEEAEIKLPTSAGSWKKQESSRKDSALLTMPIPLTGRITTNCGKLFKRWEYQTTSLPYREICKQVKKQQVELDMEQWAGSKLGKKYIKVVYCHPASFQFSRSVMFHSTASWTAAHQAPLSITNSQSLLKLKSIQWVMPSNHLILLPSIFPSIRGLSNESFLCITWSKYWNLVSFSISPSNEYSGFISFRVDWFDLLVVQETLKSLLQHHSSKASILQCSAF